MQLQLHNLELLFTTAMPEFQTQGVPWNRLINTGLVTQDTSSGKFNLTEAGKAHVQRILDLHVAGTEPT